MRVVYDHPAFAQRYGGVSRYFVELATRIAGHADCSVEVLAFAHANEYVRRLAPGVARGVYVPDALRMGRLRRRVNDSLTRLWLRRRAPEIVHESYYSPRRLAPPGPRVVVTVFDMIHERFPEHVASPEEVARLKAGAIQRADRVICISESTRRDLLEHVPVDPGKVSVIHLAASTARRAGEVRTRRVPGPYLLYVGSRAGYKNFERLLRAIGGSERLRELKLVCVGGRPLAPEERAMIDRAGLGSRVALLQGDDRLLADLYAHAEALVYPSLYEGFGLPLVEAMSLGCPVVCSRTGSMPEIVEEAGELFDPLDVDDMRSAIEAVVDSPERAARLRRLGSSRAQAFSWDRCAEQTYRVYRDLLEGP